VELCTPFFRKLKNKSKARVIAIDHNPRPLNGYTFQKKIEKKIKGILFSKYIDLFVGVSKYTVNEIVKDFGFQVKNKTLVIYNGVVIKDIQVSENRKEKYPKFLVASHLRPSKGIQDLIEAVHLLPNEIKSIITIDIYGDGIYKESLLQKSKQYQLEKAINFKGSVSNLKEIYCQYDYLLQPTHMECFSLSILESLAANIPVITTSVGGNEEVITHGLNGFIIAPKDINALKTILTNVFLGEQKIIDNTRITIENNFTIEKMVNHYINLVV
jgi:glycosyltransferase involved in cell wall biosynthesis